MADFFGWFFFQGGWQKLPWKNSWFSIAVFAAVLSGGLLVSDFSTGKVNTGFTVPKVAIPSISFFAKPGSLMVTAETSGATVLLDGQGELSTPANFPQVPVGSHTVTISAPGYETTIRKVEIKEATPFSLDAGPLTRSTGLLTLTTIPAHAAFTLKGTASDNQQERTGRTPTNLSNLPVDNYELTVDSSRDGSQKAQFQISSRQTTTEVVDLVKTNVAADADAPVAKALLAQADVSTLSDAQKKDFTGLLAREIQEYIRVGAFPQAATAIATLKNLGQDTSAQEQQLSDMQNGFEQRVAGQVKDLIADKHLGAARSKLMAVEDNIPQEMADRLNAQFQGDLGPYAQQIDDAIKASSSAAPSDGYNQLQQLAGAHPDDIKIALAMAQLLTQQAPDHARLIAQINALKQFSPDNLPSVDAGNLQAMEAKLRTELATYDRLQAAVEAEKGNSGGGVGGRIAALERAISRDEASIAAASNVNDTVNAFTGIFHTRVRVVDVSAKQTEIERDKEAIQQLTAAQQASQTNGSVAQRDFDTFCAQVPW